MEASTRYRSQDIQLKAKDFWGNKFLIIKNKQEIGSIAFHWKGYAIIGLTDTEGNFHQYTMKSKGVFKLRFELRNEADELVLTMKTINKWNKLRLDYEIEKTANEPPFDEHEFLMYCGYTANLCVSRMGSA